MTTNTSPPASQRVADQEPLSRPAARTRAFTLLELLVVVGMVALWVCLLVPTFARTQPSGRSVQCLNNQKQLTTAWKMYTDDNGGRLVANANFGIPLNGWITGTLTWGVESDNTNTLKLQNGLLGPYTKGSLWLYKCPEDGFVSPAQRARGWKSRVRSTSMNGFIEGGLYNDPSGGSTWYPAYRPYNKLSDIVQPAPSALWVFVDEQADSIADGWFITDVTTTRDFVRLPASYHNGGCNFSFADNHVEAHKWKETSTAVPVSYGAGSTYPTLGLLGDVTWLQQHSTAPR